ncbi:pilus assembly protein PilY [Pseudomonas sp. BN417]|uniref:pilus assembly protein n=1 Tax=Pseudomonas sp. BN417 TaxID=2567890 RepID=UPI002454377C|nr:PilC/PilY family type IV pilus protein [Pseudomonas sp. BN417]MDH4556801.1 pilus assembly protein PilY [Pseudomonas sp. BN417]
MRTGFLKSALVATAMALGQPGMAEDIDLFVGTTETTNDAPNVLIVLDNTANWNQTFENQRAALASVLAGLPANQFRVGLMAFTETGGGNNNTDGAYVRAAIRLMNSTNKTLYQQLFLSIDNKETKSNNGKAALAMYEAYQYFKAAAPYAGNGKELTDYHLNTSGTAASNAVYALSGNALESKNALTYNNPIASGCAKNFIIYISNGAAQENTSNRTVAFDALSRAGGRTTVIPISPTGSQDSVADEWARFMKTSSLGVVTYTLDVDRVTNGQGPGWSALLKSMAGVSGGKYFSVSSSGTQLADALKTSFSEIQAVNSAFASVSLPVSVNTQGTYLNQVFIGMFRPDENLLPRWQGNLKQYKLRRTNGNGELRLHDANGNVAINTSTNFITGCARSFWTPSDTDTYWANSSVQNNCPTVPDSDISNSPDGNVVEKGAQGYLLRSSTTRTVYTCSPTFADCNNTLTPFNTDNTDISSTLLGVANSTERTTLINWARGLDTQDEDVDAVTTAEMRRTAHGDVVHSRPVAIDYGTVTTPNVVVFYAGNDGVFRAINGNRTGTNAGNELWSFVPPEFYGKLNRLRQNTQTISFNGSTGGQPKDYGMDGPITAFRGTISGSEKTFIYAGMRRGGRALYAFDVTSPSTPVLKWKVGCPNLTNDNNCSSSVMQDIGQTWSSAMVLKAQGYGGGNSPLLIMGGGYDNCEDIDTGTANHDSSCSSGKGRRIYVLDANTGSVLQTFQTKRGVVGDVTVVPNSAGFAQYAYAADLGGNVYRITIGNNAPDAWGFTRIASLGCSDGGTGCAINRKFMFAPEVVASGDSYYLQLGSGDREKPLSSYTATAGLANYFFNLRDRPTLSSWLGSDGTCTDSGDSVICLNSLLPITSSATPTQSELNSKPKGWYLGLAASEQVVTSAITVFGQVIFNTHQPRPLDPNACSGLGTNRAYNIAYKNGAGLDGERYDVLDGGGLSPSPVGGVVELDPEPGGGSEELPFVCTLDCWEPDDVVTTITQPKGRVYWSIDRE